ncbi:MAG: site-specific integrase [Micrococcaceae bacterium]|nr:site-specific integrase [Micrococcaceae bacterium]
MASIETRKNKAGRITSYRVVWRDKNGKKMHQSVQDENSALQWKTLLEQVDHDTKAAEMALIRSNSQSPTLYTLADEHLDLLIVSPGTIRRYKGYIKNHFEKIGPIPVDTLMSADLIRWVKYMLDRGLSPKTISNVHGFIHGVVQTAVELKHRSDNPCHGRYLPDDDATEDKNTFLTMDEFRSILQYVPAHNQPAMSFMIATGLRLGEMTALTPGDLMLDAAVPSVRVTKSHQEGEDAWVVGPPKTPESRRTVSLPPSTVTALRELVQGLGVSDQVFTSRKGAKGAAHRTWQRTWFNAVSLAKKHDGLYKSPRIHDLRHSHASLMIAAGMNLFELSKRLGHKNVETTTRIYGHLMPGAHFKAASIMEDILSEKPAKQIV